MNTYYIHAFVGVIMYIPLYLQHNATYYWAYNRCTCVKSECTIGQV